MCLFTLQNITLSIYTLNGVWVDLFSNHSNNLLMIEILISHINPCAGAIKLFPNDEALY